jgi:hypothetical protein
MDELNMSWGVMETPAERATVTMERVAVILEIMMVVVVMMGSETLFDEMGDLV